MKISFIELDFHFDSVDGFCKIFEHTNHELSVFTKPQIFEKIKHNAYVKKYKWFFCNNISRTKFLRDHIDEINAADVIFINTIANEFGAYVKADFRRTTISRTHNAFKLLDPWHHIRIYPSPLYFWKAFSYFIREIMWFGFWHYRPKLLKKIDYFIFPDKGITDYILSRNLINPKKVLPPLSLKVFEPATTREPSREDYFRITIIGSVDQRRRQYEPVIDAFRQLTPLINRPVKLSLLGKASGKYARNVIHELKNLESDTFNLEYFDDQVKQDVFDDVMSKTHIVLSPVNLQNSTEIFGEIYGKTKISGSLLDVLRFPKTMIIPAEYNLDSDFKTLFDQYNDALDLKNIILKYLSNENFLTSKNALIRGIIQEKYNESALAEQFVSMVTKVLTQK
jgi:glycosyltransferase involved in cell wall biosynthesis